MVVSSKTLAEGQFPAITIPSFCFRLIFTCRHPTGLDLINQDGQFQNFGNPVKMPFQGGKYMVNGPAATQIWLSVAL